MMFFRVNEVMNAVAVAIVLGGVSTDAAQILTHINPWQKAGCIPELIKVSNVIVHHSRHCLNSKLLAENCDG